MDLEKIQEDINAYQVVLVKILEDFWQLKTT